MNHTQEPKYCQCHEKQSRQFIFTVCPSWTNDGLLQVMTIYEYWALIGSGEKMNLDWDQYDWGDLRTPLNCLVHLIHDLVVKYSSYFWSLWTCSETKLNRSLPSISNRNGGPSNWLLWYYAKDSFTELPINILNGHQTILTLEQIQYIAAVHALGEIYLCISFQK